MMRWDRQFNLIIRWAMTLALLCGPRLTAQAEPHSPNNTFVVTKTADTNDGVCDADCSLREAIVAANAQPGADNVIVPAGIYTLTIPGTDEDAGATGDLDITDDLTLTGAGAEATVVDGGGIDGLFDVMQFVTTTITMVKLTGGYTSNTYYTGVGIANKGVVIVTNSFIISNTGTAIRNDLGTLTLINVTISENTMGGVSNVGGTAVVTGSTISNNTFPGFDNFYGGSYPNEIPGTLSIADSVVSDNHNPDGFIGGGGVSMQAGILTITHSVFANNTDAGAAGGVSVSNIMAGLPWRVTIVNSTFDNNAPRGAAFNSSGNDTLNISSSIFSNNHDRSGAGVHIFGSARATISNSTFVQNIATNNTSQDGGGLYIYGGANIINSTFSGNVATGSGGGLYVTGSITTGLLSNVTISNNMANSDNDGDGSGGGYVGNSYVQDTIIANNDLGSGQPSDCAGTLLSLGYNLIQDPTGCVISGTLTGVITSTDPLLGPLQDNGGPTFTHAPLPGSPVIDAGNPATPGSGNGACEVVDQRGYIRPVDGDGNSSAICDIGAVEAGSAPGVAFTANAVNVNEAESLATLTVTLSATRTETITVEYATNDGTALAGSDYVTTTGTLTFAPGSTLMTFTVPIVEDILDEPDESFTVTLSNPVNALMGGYYTLALTIVDNDIEHRVYVPMLRR